MLKASGLGCFNRGLDNFMEAGWKVHKQDISVHKLLGVGQDWATPSCSAGELSGNIWVDR